VRDGPTDMTNGTETWTGQRAVRTRVAPQRPAVTPS